jgi:hypothetical protein
MAGCLWLMGGYDYIAAGGKHMSSWHYIMMRLKSNDSGEES